MNGRVLLSRVRARETFRHTIVCGGFGGFVIRIAWHEDLGWVADLDREGAGFSVYSRARRLTRHLPVATV